MKKILIIDDDTKIRSIYMRLLTDEGFDVIEAKDAEQGTGSMIRSRYPVDLILLDINMPVVDGCEMKDIIDKMNPDIKVIVASVYPVDEQKRLIPYATDYFDKSQSTEVLKIKINRALDDAMVLHQDPRGSIHPGKQKENEMKKMLALSLCTWLVLSMTTPVFAQSKKPVNLNAENLRRAMAAISRNRALFQNKEAMQRLQRLSSNMKRPAAK